MYIFAGKAVFCEKPLAKTVPAVMECYKLAQRLNLPLMCGFNRYNFVQARFFIQVDEAPSLC